MPLLPPPDPDTEGRQKLSHYTHHAHLGSGTFAEVSSYHCTLQQQQPSPAPPVPAMVAIKRVSREHHSHGVNLGALKEIQVLGELQGHPNLLSLSDVFTFGGRVHLVLELCEGGTLQGVARDTRTPLPEATVKGYLRQLLGGLAHVHGRRYMHRDIKCENILLTKGGGLKLADFGHAVALGGGGFQGQGQSPPTPPPLFHRVVTLWYRAPELLCRGASHGPAVDLWSVGCVLGELLLRGPLFPGQPGPMGGDRGEEEAQLAAIFRLLGTPVDPWGEGGGGGRQRALGVAGVREEDVVAMGTPGGEGRMRGLATHLPLWPGCTSLPGFPAHMDWTPPQPWRAMHPALQSASSHAVDLLSRLLVYDPALRLTAKEALAHPWFRSA